MYTPLHTKFSSLNHFKKFTLLTTLFVTILSSQEIVTRGPNLIRVSVFPIKSSVNNAELTESIYTLYVHNLQKAGRFHIVEKEKVKDILSEYSLALSGIYEFDESKPLDAINLGFAEYFVLPVFQKGFVQYLSKKITTELSTNATTKTTRTYEERVYRREFAFEHKLLNTRQNKISYSDNISVFDETKVKHLIATHVIKKSSDGKTSEERNTSTPVSIETEERTILDSLIRNSVQQSISTMFRAIDFTGSIIAVRGKNDLLIDLGKSQGIKGKYNLTVKTGGVQKIYHPTTGQLMEITSDSKPATLRITHVDKDYSVAKIVRGNFSSIQPGNEIKISNNPLFQSELFLMNFLLPGTGFFKEKRTAPGVADIIFIGVGVGVTAVFNNISKEDYILKNYKNTLDTVVWEDGTDAHTKGKQYGAAIAYGVVAQVLSVATTAIIHGGFSLGAAVPGQAYNPLAVSYDPIEKNTAVAYTYRF